MSSMEIDYEGSNESKQSDLPNDNSTIASVRYKGRLIKDIISETKNTTDILWLTLMAHAISINPTTQEDMWIITNTESNESLDICCKCREVGGSCVLIKCQHGHYNNNNNNTTTTSSSKCSLKYHLECAYHDGGLQLDTKNRLLIQSCNQHFNPPLFCSCKTIYDESRIMIFCDSCYDWYHIECEGIQNHHINHDNNDQYICKNCLVLTKHNKTISEEIKNKNLLKDTMSSDMQLANEIICQLIKVTLTVCPILNEILFHHHDNHQQQEQNQLYINYYIKDIQDAYQFLSSTIFIQKETFSFIETSTKNQGKSDQKSGQKRGQKSEENDDDDENEIIEEDLMELIGVRHLINSWRELLYNYIETYNNWYNETIQQFPIIIKDFIISLDIHHQSTLEEIYNNLQHLIINISKELKYIPSDLYGLNLVCDAIHWMITFLQKFHIQRKPDNWFQTLSALNRVAEQKVKQMNIAAKESYFSRAFIEIFTQFLKNTSKTISLMSGWYNKAVAVINKKSHYTVEDIESLLNDAEKFPTFPLFYEELLEISNDVKNLKENILMILQRNDVEMDELQSLLEKKNELGVDMPMEVERKLISVRARFVFLQSYEFATSRPRINLDLACRLCTDAKDALKLGIGLEPSPLSMQLDESIAKAVEYLEGIIGEAQQVASAIPEDLLHGDAVMNEQELDKLKSLKIITPEEEFMQYLIDIEDLELRRKGLQPTVESPELLSTMEELLSDYDKVMNIRIEERFSRAMTRKNDLEASISELKSMCVNARKYWNLVQQQLEELQKGVLVSKEQLEETLKSALETKLTNEEIHNNAQSILEKSAGLESIILDKLDTIRSASNEDVVAVGELLNEVKHLPLPSLILQQVQQRVQLCKIVQESLNILREPENNEMPVSDREVAKSREITTRVIELSEKIKDEPELSLLLSIKSDILLHFWRREVKRIWQDEETVETAKAHIEKGQQMLGDKVEGTEEWQEICSAVKEAERFGNDAAAALDELNSARDNFFQTHGVENEQSGLIDILAPHEIIIARLCDEGVRLRIHQKQVDRQLRESLTLLNVMKTAFVMANEIERVVNSPLQVDTDPIMYLHSRVKDHVTVFRDLTGLIHNLTGAIDICRSRDDDRMELQIKFLNYLVKRLEKLHMAASEWNQKAMNLVPAKTTRIKARNASQKNITKECAIELLSQPIARALTMPMHERLLKVIETADQSREQLRDFLLSKHLDNDVIRLHGKDYFQHPTFVAQLQQDLHTVRQMKAAADVIPLELPDTELLNWLILVLECTSSVPYPGDDPSLSSIPLEIANERWQQFEQLMGRIPQPVVELMEEMGVIHITDEAGFYPSAHPNISRANKLCDHLKEEINKCEELQDNIKNSDQYNFTLEELLQLQQSVAQCLVQVPVDIRRLLEKRIDSEKTKQKKEQRSVTSGKNGKKRARDESTNDNSAYWVESPKGVDTKGGKRAKHQTDSLVTVVGEQTKTPKVGATVSSVEPEIPKGPDRPCANPDCVKIISARKKGCFCSVQCTLTMVPQWVDSLLNYRRIICFYGSAKKKFSQKLTPQLVEELKNASVLDWQMYTRSDTLQNCYWNGATEITESLEKNGLVARSGHDTDGTPRDKLDELLVSQELLRRASNIHADQRPTASELGIPRAFHASEAAADSSPRGRHKKAMTIFSMLSTLPPAAGPLLLRGDVEEIQNHGASIKMIGGIPPPPYSNGSGASNPDEEHRLKAKYGFEDIFMRSLLRQNCSGAFCQAAILALLVEDKLYNKYVINGKFDKRKYLNHFLALLRNLKREHNDGVVHKLVCSELTVEELLDMNVNDLANQSLRLEREQIAESSIQDRKRMNTEEVMNLRQKELRDSGKEEAWRSTEETFSSEPTTINSESGMLPRSSSLSMDEADAVSDTSATQREAGNKSKEQVDTGVGVVEGEQQQRKPKRPIDVDAMTRFTRPKTSSSDTHESREDNASDTKKPQLSRSNSNSSQNLVQPPSLIGNIKANAGTKQQGGPLTVIAEHSDDTTSFAGSRHAPLSASPRGEAMDVDDTDATAGVVGAQSNEPSSPIASDTKKNRPALTLQPLKRPIKMMNNIGQYLIAFKNPAHEGSYSEVTLKGEAWVMDRQLQGLIAPSCSIKGRVKVEEFNRAMDALQQYHQKEDRVRKKLYAPFKMIVSGSSNKSYENFCREFGHNQRVGLCTWPDKKVQVYFVPPVFKRSHKIFSCFPDPGKEDIVYGVITSKEVGPERFVNATHIEEPSSVSNGTDVPATQIPPPPRPPKIPQPIQSSSIVSAPPRNMPPPPPQLSVPPLAPSPSQGGGPAAVASLLASDSQVMAIKKVARFCVEKGVHTINKLKEKPESRNIMPFLYEDHPSYGEFVDELKRLVAQKSNQN